MTEIFLKSIVWTDSYLAILFAILIPLVLLIWTTVQKVLSIQHLLMIYWRVASLSLISLYLLIPVWQLGYITAFIAKILILISLWFWIDINDEIRDLPKTKLKLAITSWRWTMTLYCFFGAIANMLFLSCAFVNDASSEQFCPIWLELPWFYKSFMHPNATTGFLGFLGMTGLIVYSMSFVYFILFRLIKQGRIALEQ